MVYVISIMCFGVVCQMSKLYIRIYIHSILPEKIEYINNFIIKQNKYLVIYYIKNEIL
jgi:hypothetical protein